MNSFAGMPIRVDPILCKWRHDQIKTHRKARINKKWRKTYGMRATCIATEGYSAFGKLLMCPHMLEALKKGMAVKAAVTATIRQTDPRPHGIIHSER